MRPLFALLAMLGFVLAVVLGPLPTTRVGLQCPTAPVQTVASRDCCGRLVDRAPRPGEKGFVQCRCAERKAGAQKANAVTKVVLFLDTAPALEAAAAQPLAAELPFEAAAFRSADSPPFVRPPASA